MHGSSQNFKVVSFKIDRIKLHQILQRNNIFMGMFHTHVAISLAFFLSFDFNLYMYFDQRDGAITSVILFTQKLPQFHWSSNILTQTVCCGVDFFQNSEIPETWLILRKS